MRPDDRGAGFDDLLDAGMDLPFDADLESLDRELAESGANARRMLHGRTQPTRVFSNELRTRLLAPLASPVAIAVATPIAVPIVGSAGARETSRPPVVSGETRPPTRDRAAAARRPLLPVRALLAMLAAVALLVVAALGGSFEVLLH